LPDRVQRNVHRWDIIHNFSGFVNGQTAVYRCLTGKKSLLNELPFDLYLNYFAAGGNRRCIDLIMGHTSKDTGNRVYNHKTIEELRATVELISI